MVAVQIDKSISRYYLRIIIRQTFETFWLKISFSVNCALMFACELPKRGAGGLLLLLCSIGSLELKLSRFLYIFTRFVFYLLLYSLTVYTDILTGPSQLGWQVWQLPHQYLKDLLRPTTPIYRTNLRDLLLPAIPIF